MKIFCETIFSDMLPAVRAIITNELIKTYGLNQMEVAQKLGITQPAVSQYLNGLRGRRVKLLVSNPRMMKLIKKLAAEIATRNIKLYEKTCEICGESIKEKLFSDKELYPFICLIEISKRKVG